MKFPFFWLSFGLTLGILAAYRLQLPAWLLWPCVLWAVPFLWWLRGRRLFLPLLLVTLALLGIILLQEKTGRPANAVENWAGAKGERSNWCSLEGVVWSHPEIKTTGKKHTLSFVLASRNLMRCGKGRCGLFETSGFVQVFIAQPPEVPEVGDRIRLRGALEKPVPVLNPGQFDYAAYLAASDIYAIFTAYGARSLRVVRKNELPRWRQWIAGVRQTLARKLDRMFNAADAATFKALILGLRKGLAPELRDDFMVTGTAHILAISGLNISLVAGSLYFAMIVLRVSQKTAALAGLLVALAYVFISGAQIPVQRAGWMAGAVFIALLFEREHQFWNSYCLSFFVLLLVDPRRVLDVSFQLSFISIFALVYLMPRIFERWRWKESLGRHVGVMLGTTPVVLYYFNVFSIISLIANLVAIPLFHLGLLSCFLALLLDPVPVLSAVAAVVAARIVETANLWIHQLAKLEWGYFFLPTPQLLQLGIYYGSLMLGWGASRIKKNIWRWLQPAVAGIWLLAAGSFFWANGPQGFRLTVLAAGQNEMIHVQYDADIHWMMNVGRGVPSDQGRWLVSPYLRSQGINFLTGIMVTDAASKHTGSLEFVLKHFSPDYFVYPEGIKTPMRFGPGKLWGKTNRIVVGPGEIIRMRKGGSLRILGVVNGQSLLLIQHGIFKFLFLPAINREVIGVLANTRDQIWDIQTLILPAMRSDQGAEAMGLLETLFDLVDPVLVTSNRAETDLRDFLKDRDIRLVLLENAGAVTFSQPADKSLPFLRKFPGRFTDILTIDSFRQGFIMNMM